MRDVTLKVYRFAELNQRAKNRAKQDYQAVHGYMHADEMMLSIQALAKHFGGTMCDWSIDWFNTLYSHATFKMPCDWDHNEIAERLDELGEYNPETLKGTGECKLTGYCGDEYAIDGFRKSFFDGEDDIDSLMEAAFRSWLEAGQSDCDAGYEDDEFAQHCDANDMEFYEDGEAF